MPGHNAYWPIGIRHWQLRDTGLLVLTMWSVHRLMVLGLMQLRCHLANEYETSLAHVPQTGGAL